MKPPPDLYTFASLFAAIASWQEQIEWSLRIVAGLVALAAGILAIVDRRRRARSGKPLD